MAEPARRDRIAHLLSTVPTDLRWCADCLERDGGPEHAPLAAKCREISDRAERALASEDAVARWDCLSEAVPQQRAAAQILRVTEVRDQRHQANNMLQAVENATWVLSKIPRPTPEPSLGMGR